MALFDRGRQLKVTLVGDSRQLERTLGRTEGKLKSFGKSFSQGTAAGGLFGLGRGGTFAAGTAAVALGLRSIVNANREAEVVLGQTSVAVRDAGLSWEAYAGHIEAAATDISRSAAFDDEDVLRSFGVFVRGQKDVEKSLDLTSLAANVARGRYTDLETATMLVNKAAMGQIGALRRAGIQIDKNATAAQALAALQKAYAGAAKQYGDTNAAAADKMAVSWENLKESAGESFANALGKAESGIASVGNAIEDADKKTGSWLDKLNGLKSFLGVPILGDTKPLDLTGIVAFPQEGTRGFGRGPQPAKPKPPVVMKQLPNRLVGRELDARISGNQKLLRDVLEEEAKVLRGALKNPRLKLGDRNSLKQALLGITEELDAMDQDAVDAANQRKQDAADARAEAKRKADEAARKRKDAMVKALRASEDFANDLLDKALGRLERQQDKIEIGRDLTDAREHLRVAKLIGDPFGIRNANREIADAEMAQRQWRLEGAKVQPVNASTANFVINGMTVVANDPGDLIAAVQKAAKRNAGQTRGRAPGVTGAGGSGRGAF